MAFESKKDVKYYIIEKDNVLDVLYRAVYVDGIESDEIKDLKFPDIEMSWEDFKIYIYELDHNIFCKSLDILTKSESYRLQTNHKPLYYFSKIDNF